MPTERGLVLFDVLEHADQALVDPAVTAKLEFLLDEVLFGRRRAEEAIDAVCGQAARIIGRIQDGTPSDRAPLLAVSSRLSPMARGTSANKRRTAHTPGSPPPEEGGQSDIPRHRARPAPGRGRSSALPEGAAPGRRPSAQKVAKADGRASSAGKRADQEKGHATEFGPMKQGGGRGKLIRVAVETGDARQSSSANNGTRLKIPFGNKELAMRLGARYRTGGWFAPPGTNLEPFQEKGWL